MIQSDIMGQQIKIFTIRLYKNNPEIIPDPPLEYLKYVTMIQISRFFPRTFSFKVTYVKRVLGRVLNRESNFYSTVHEKCVFGIMD